MTSRPVTNWPRAMAKRLGIGGDVKFTRAAVGQTLHLHCGAGDHIVDEPIPANMHPDAIAKKLLAKGWVMGSKLKCPEHSRRKERQPRKAKLLSDTAPRTVTLSHIADKILSGEMVLKTTTEDKTGPLSGNRKVEPNRYQRRILEKEAHYPKSKPVFAKPDIIKEAKAAEKKEQEGKPMPTATQQPTPQPTDAAKKARRMVYLLLEEQYDEATNRYRPGWDDRKLAQESGASLNVVQQVREESFGPLGEPAELASLRTEYAQFRADAKKQMDAIQQTMTHFEGRLSRICHANGWSNV